MAVGHEIFIDIVMVLGPNRWKTSSDVVPWEQYINTLSPEQNDDTWKCILLNWNYCIPIYASLGLVLKGPIEKKSSSHMMRTSVTIVRYDMQYIQIEMHRARA